MSKNIYYNPKKILSLKDLEKKEPTFYLISTNRSAGKTTCFLKMALENFHARREQFVLLYRYKYELTSCATLFDDIMRLYPELQGEINTVNHAQGLFVEMLMNGETIGFAISMNNPDVMKKYSPLFAGVEMCIFDEFQTESGKYLPKETEKLQSLLLTIARGGGRQSRPIKVFMLSNNVSIMNPYYIEFGIHKRIKSDTKFMRGIGWVAEFGFNESASKNIQENGIARAFQNSNYLRYSSTKEYLHVTDAFIEKISGRSRYLFTIVHLGKKYGVREYMDEGIIHVSHKVDDTFKYIITLKASDHNQNTLMLNNYSFLIDNIKKAFKHGYLRFDDLETKNAIFDILAIDLYS